MHAFVFYDSSGTSLDSYFHYADMDPVQVLCSFCLNLTFQLYLDVTFQFSPNSQLNVHIFLTNSRLSWTQCLNT